MPSAPDGGSRSCRTATASRAILRPASTCHLTCHILVRLGGRVEGRSKEIGTQMFFLCAGERMWYDEAMRWLRFDWPRLRANVSFERLIRLPHVRHARWGLTATINEARPKGPRIMRHTGPRACLVGTDGGQLPMPFKATRRRDRDAPRVRSCRRRLLQGCLCPHQAGSTRPCIRRPSTNRMSLSWAATSAQSSVGPDRRLRIVGCEG